MKLGLNSMQLKLIAVIFMIFDHIYSYIFIGVWPNWFSLLARFVAPLFVFLLVQGFHHTLNKRKYLYRLLTAAIITLIGEAIINIYFHNVDILTKKMTLYSILNGNDILITLAIFFGILWNIDIFKETHKKRNILFIVLLAILSLFFEGGLYLLPVLFIFEFTKNKSKNQILLITIWCLAIFIKAIFSAYQTNTSMYSMLCFNSEWMMVSVLPFIILYNGKYGKKTIITKYFFYCIYPIHLWLLMIIHFLIIRK